MKDLEIRELRGDDVFPLLSIIGATNITEEFSELMGGKDAVTLPALPTLPLTLVAKQAKGEKLSKTEAKQFNDFNMKLKEIEAEREAITAKNGVRVMSAVLKKILINAHLAKSEINNFLANLTGSTSAEIGGLRIDKYTTLVVKLFKRPEIKDVFTSAASLMGSMEGSTSLETDSTDGMETH